MSDADAQREYDEDSGLQALLSRAMTGPHGPRGLAERPAAGERCEHVRPGQPSVNRPGEWVVEPWRCVLSAGHDSPHAKVPVCPQVALRKQGHDWTCVRAAGHAGEHVPPVEAKYVPRPLRELDREMLIGAASMAFGAAESIERDANEQNARLYLWQAKVEYLASAALDGLKSPHGNNHTDGCWRRHPYCFAFAIIGSGALGRAVENAGTLPPRD